MFCFTSSLYSSIHSRGSLIPLKIRIRNPGLCPSLEKSNTDVRETQLIISVQSSFCSLNFTFFFVRQRNFFFCLKWGLAPSQLWINFHRKPQHQLLLIFIYHPSAHWQPHGASDASALCITSKDSSGTGARVSGRAHPAPLPSARSLEDSREQQTSRNSPLPTLLMLCGKASIASQRRGIAEVDFWPSSHVLRSMQSKESLQMIIPQMRKKPSRCWA